MSASATDSRPAPTRQFCPTTARDARACALHRHRARPDERQSAPSTLVAFPACSCAFARRRRDQEDAAAKLTTPQPTIDPSMRGCRSAASCVSVRRDSRRQVVGPPYGPPQGLLSSNRPPLHRLEAPTCGPQPPKRTRRTILTHLGPIALQPTTRRTTQSALSSRGRHTPIHPFFHVGPIVLSVGRGCRRALCDVDIGWPRVEARTLCACACRFDLTRCLQVPSHPSNSAFSNV